MLKVTLTTIIPSIFSATFSYSQIWTLSLCNNHIICQSHAGE
jgi:hypothetical protein